jgi:protein gp37
MNRRFGGRDYDYQYKPTDFYLDEKTLAQPLHWRKPRTVFVCSMCDLFHENVDWRIHQLVIDRMAAAKHCTFLVLTKRPETMGRCFSKLTTISSKTWPLPIPNVWIGVTAENQEEADKRIPILLSIPAAKHFISYEPALGALKIAPEFLYPMHSVSQPGNIIHRETSAIDWLITGCESGPGARPANIDWFRSLRDQCVAANVPFFLKQMMVDGKLVKMPLLDGQQWAQRP